MVAGSFFHTVGETSGTSYARLAQCGKKQAIYFLQNQLGLECILIHW
jgi:hypothetical protein